MENQTIQSYLLPLYLTHGEQLLSSGDVSNIPDAIRAQCDAKLGRPSGTTSPREMFDYSYALFYSETYRTRYRDFLRGEFPRVMVTASEDLFDALRRFGSRLVALHTLAAGPGSGSAVGYIGPSAAQIKRVAYEDGFVSLEPAQNVGFRRVPPEVWEFRIGGYQVCEKWLKDRKGRSLTPDDIEHYKHIIGAIEETIRIQKEIDEVIEAHGGWPLAGSVPGEDAE